MIEFLESAFAETGVKPDVVFSGHVHNYQRMQKQYPDGDSVLFIVAGGGGYDELHPVASEDDDRFTNENSMFQGVQLLNYCDDKHGFLKISIERGLEGLSLSGAYYSIPHEEEIDSDDPAVLADEFLINLRR